MRRGPGKHNCVGGVQVDTKAVSFGFGRHIVITLSQLVVKNVSPPFSTYLIKKAVQMGMSRVSPCNGEISGRHTPMALPAAGSWSRRRAYRTPLAQMIPLNSNFSFRVAKDLMECLSVLRESCRFRVAKVE
jgi:hypothetical protein